ncbi:hypothetical protein FA13DRAFT_1801098 [Coprinellus micaceus]|uniref:Uncharacterized protein n=1 Tax=Coprinellus micaceus TaxID=71717 RepID=A0A4Y7SEM7_COPMI|nr:hypothetical protein FA13DRAFT_1801098 [Coprinellus micaceus]
MTDVVVRGNGRGLEKVNPSISDKAKNALVNHLTGGMSEERFWATFAQCLVCKQVTLQKNFAFSHKCGAKAFRKVHPYSRNIPGTPSPPSSGSSRSVDSLLSGSSPAPTETAKFDCDEGYGAFGDLEFLGLLIGDELERSPTASLSFSRDAAAISEGDTAGAGSDGYLADDDDEVRADPESEGVPSELDDSFKLLSLIDIIQNTA